MMKWECDHINPSQFRRSVSNQNLNCFHSRLFRRTLKNTSKVRFTGLCDDRWIPLTQGQLRGKCFHLTTSSCMHLNLKNNFKCSYKYIDGVNFNFLLPFSNNRSRIHWNMKWINGKFVVNFKLRGKSPTGQTHYSYQESFPYDKIPPIPQSCIGPISIRRRSRYRANIGMLISKWHIELCFTNVKWNIYPTSEWSTSFRQQNSIVQVTQLHQIDSSPISAAISGQHRDADVAIISKWHIYRCRNHIFIRHRMT